MMSKNLDKIKKQYENERILPSAELWLKLENELDSNVNLGSNKKHFSWLKYAAVLVLLISLTSLVVWNLSTPEQQNIAKHKEIIENTNKKETNPIIEEKAIEKVSNNKLENKPIIEKKAIANRDAKEVKNENSFEKNQVVSKDILPIKQTEKFVNEINIVENPNPKVIAEVKEPKYIKSSELLMGAELDKTRQEQNLNSKKLGTIYLHKIKLKPKSFQILGKSVVSDSVSLK